MEPTDQDTQAQASPRHNSHAAVLLLVTGALVGVLLAAAGLLESEPGRTPDQVARINDTVISSTQLEDYVSQMNADTPVPRDRNYLLEQMIDEELLVQRGLELGLVLQSTPVRNAIIEAVTRRFSGSTAGTEVSEAELRAYYEQNIDRFLPPTVYVVEVVPAAPAQPSTTPLTYPSLLARFGPDVAAAIARLTPGTQTLAGDNTAVRLIRVEGGVAPPFEQIRALVAANLTQEQDAQAFRQYLTWLRERADIDISPP